MKIRQNKMMGYLAVTAGVGCASSAANAAVVIYGNASNPNILADPIGINIGGDGFAWYIDRLGGFEIHIPWGVLERGFPYFTRGDDLGAIDNVGGYGYYGNSGFLANGAVLGNQNYASVSFDGNDGVYEAVAQFYLDGAGGGYLMAIATTNPITNPQDLSTVGGPSLSISAGKAMIDAAPVPEPSSLVLLALGATGLAALRQRRKAA